MKHSQTQKLLSFDVEAFHPSADVWPGQHEQQPFLFDVVEASIRNHYALPPYVVEFLVRFTDLVLSNLLFECNKIVCEVSWRSRSMQCSSEFATICSNAFDLCLMSAVAKYRR